MHTDTAILTTIPPPVLARLRRALGAFDSWQRAIEAARLAETRSGCPGRHEWAIRYSEEFLPLGLRQCLRDAERTLVGFIAVAPTQGVDPEAVLAALGGRPALPEEGAHVHDWWAIPQTGEAM